MFDTIDAIDIVSLFLGAALSYLMAHSIAQRRSDLPAFAILLLFIGLGLILAYVLSELLHRLRGG